MKAFHFLLFMVLATAGFSVSNFALSEEEATTEKTAIDGLNRPEACNASPYSPYYVCTSAIVAEALLESMAYKFNGLALPAHDEQVITEPPNKLEAPNAIKEESSQGR